MLAGAATDISLLTPELVVDLSPGVDPAGLVVQSMTAFDGDVIVSQRISSLGLLEIVRIDSQSSQQTVLHRVDNRLSTAITVLAELNGTLVFVSDSIDAGVELWRTDGTVAGTTLITTIEGYSNRAQAVVAGGSLYFLGVTSGDADLWKTDGTAAGTMLVKNFQTTPGHLTEMNGALFLYASSGGSGGELWKSDGTTAGTVLVKDIRPGSAGSNVNGFINADGALFFTANDGVNGEELWTSDGTEAGTVRISQLGAGSADAEIDWLTAVGTSVYFTARSSSTGLELFTSDGTLAGTRVVKDIRPGSTSTTISGLTNVNGTLFFSANDGINGAELWKSDGTDAGTVMVQNIWPGLSSSTPLNLVAVGSSLFFSAQTQAEGRELWTSDGTSAGTQLVANLAAGSAGLSISSAADSSAVADGQLFFLANDSQTGLQIWKSNGQAAGTMAITSASVAASSGISDLTTVNGITFFTRTDDTTGISLWRTDGTAAGTSRVIDFPQWTSGAPRSFTAYNGAIYFIIDDNVHGWEIWKTDGTTAGTSVLKDIRPGAADGLGFSSNLVVFNNLLYFEAIDDVSGSELWKSDGTEAGTVIAQDLVPGISGSGVNSLIVFQDWLYFEANAGPENYELWRTDGSPTGAQLIKDINPGPGNSSLGRFVNLGGVLTFFATNGTNGVELWRTDGTAAGTVMVKDIRPGSSGTGTEFQVAIGGTLYFTANDGTHGIELWKSDGTEAGTVLVKDIVPGPGGSGIERLFNIAGTLYFYAGAAQLWKSDGTPEGTQFLADHVDPIVASAMVTNVNGQAWFAKASSTDGYELWTTDGTPLGTQQIAELAVPGSSRPAFFTVNGSTVYFTAASNDTGRELWKVNLQSKATAVLENAPVGTDLGLLSATDPDSQETFTYTLVDGVGSTGNSLFSIAGQRLTTAAVLNYEAQSSHSIRVRVTGSDGLSFEQILTIDVIDDPSEPISVISQATQVNGASNINRSGIRELRLEFTVPVTISSAAALRLFNHTTGQLIDLTAATLSNNGTTSITWNLAGINLPNGRYTAVLLTESTAPGLVAPYTCSFHKLTGDVNGDGQVSFDDYGTIQANFAVPGVAFGPGDANGNGIPTFDDYGVVQANFGTALAPLHLDFGDAPDSAGYRTTLAEDGARHVQTGNQVFLGASRDAEADGQPTVDSSGDGTDEDGVLIGNLQPGAAATATVTAQVPAGATAFLNAWVDFNADGDWDDVGEHVITDSSVLNGVTVLEIVVPQSAVLGDAYSRFRLTTAAGYSSFGLAPDGEVEDHRLTIVAPQNLVSTAVLAAPALAGPPGNLTSHTHEFAGPRKWLAPVLSPVRQAPSGIAPRNASSHWSLPAVFDPRDALTQISHLAGESRRPRRFRSR